MTIGGDINSYGNKFTAISFNPKTTKLNICTTLGTNTNYCYNSAKNLPRKKFINIQVRQTLDIKQNIYKYIISIDNVLSYTVNNLTPLAIRNVKLWVSDPWNDAADVTVRNLVFENLPHGKRFEK